jgi:DnaK suppressor protein
VSKTPAKSAAPEKESAKKPAAADKAAPAKASPVKSATAAPAKAAADKAPSTKTAGAAPAPARAAQAPTPSTASFTDRFAPAKQATKTYPEPMNAVKTAAKADPKLANAWKTKAGRDMTEAELLAMPESEYMNDKQLEFFRSRLQEQKDALLSNAGETTEHLREDTSIVPDPADRATIEEEHALELRTRDRERKLLKKISQSLARIEAGDYGYCDETGEPIGLGRLLARPTATLSLEAQQRREMKQKMFGD